MQKTDVVFEMMRGRKMMKRENDGLMRNHEEEMTRVERSGQDTEQQ
jgi:hypothetical protein